eukprot:Sspe_Gene.59469::Locus_32653_Transcript_1_1_Confidence_1.000_Length_6391::g.59469::m.59469
MDSRRRVEEWAAHLDDLGAGHSTGSPVFDLGPPRWIHHIFTLSDLRLSHSFRTLGRTRAVYNLFEAPLFVIPPRARLRMVAIRISDSVHFDKLIFLVIILNCVNEVLDASSLQHEAWMQAVDEYSSFVFVVIFLLEALLKVIAAGFVLHRYSYLRNPWNVLDFIILIASLVVLGLTDSGVDGAGGLTMIRIVRLIRPLRAIRRVRGMQVLVKTIVASFPLLFDVVLLLLFVLFTFAILGMQFWGGLFHQRCYGRAPGGEPFLVLNDSHDACGGGRGCAPLAGYDVGCEVHDSFTYPIFTYDNIWEAMLLVSKVTSLDDWPDDMFVTQDASHNAVWIYFVVLVLVGGYFCLNLVLAILVVVFSESQRRLTGVKNKVVPTAEMGNSSPEYPVFKLFVPKDKFRKKRREGSTFAGPGAARLPPAKRAELIVARLFGKKQPYMKQYFKDLNVIRNRQAEKERKEQQLLQLQEAAEDDLLVGPKFEGSVRRIPDCLCTANLAGLVLFQSLLAVASPSSLLVKSPLENLSDISSEPEEIKVTTESSPRTADLETLPTPNLSVADSLVRSNSTRKERRRKKGWCREAGRLVDHEAVQGAVMLVTLVDVVLLATDHYGISETHLKVIEHTSYVASCIFLLEGAVKIPTLGVVRYFTDPFNAVDFLVVLVSIPHVFRVLDTGAVAGFRVLRAVRFYASFGKSQAKLLFAVGSCLMDILALCALELLLVFIFGLLGTNLFRDKYPPSSRATFQTIWEAAVTVFIVCTGDGWSSIMKDGIQGTSWAAVLYFITLFWLGGIILKFLYVAILIDRMAGEVRRRKRLYHRETLKKLGQATRMTDNLSSALSALKGSESETSPTVTRSRWATIALVAAGTAVGHHRKQRERNRFKKELKDWAAGMSGRHGRPFWWNKRTGERQWTNPFTLPPPTLHLEYEEETGSLPPQTPTPYEGTLADTESNPELSILVCNSAGDLEGVEVEMKEMDPSPTDEKKVQSKRRRPEAEEWFFAPGADVMVWWAGPDVPDGAWYSAVVLGQRDDKTFTVAYKDSGEVSVGVHPSCLRAKGAKGWVYAGEMMIGKERLQRKLVKGMNEDRDILHQLKDYYGAEGEDLTDEDDEHVRAMLDGKQLYPLGTTARSLIALPLTDVLKRQELHGMQLLWEALSEQGRNRLLHAWDNPNKRRRMLFYWERDGTLTVEENKTATESNEPTNPIDTVFKPHKVQIVSEAEKEETEDKHLSIQSNPTEAPDPCHLLLTSRRVHQCRGLGGSAIRATIVGFAGGDEAYSAEYGSASITASGSPRLGVMRLASQDEAPSSPGSAAGREAVMHRAGSSLGIFSQDHVVRRALATIVLHPRFNDFMLLIILINAVFLALDDYYANERPGGRRLLDIGNMVFVVIFILELVAKVIVLGLYRAPSSYFRSRWNRIDAVVVVAQILELTPIGIGRELRGARTIRLLVRSPEIKVVCELLLKVLPEIFRVCGVCFAVWLAFGVVGVRYFKGQFNECNDLSVVRREDCVGTYLVPTFNATSTVMVPQERRWVGYRVNFDNIGMAFLALFELAVLEGWETIMWRAVDADRENVGPVTNANPVRCLYFILFVLVGHYFCVNLFVGMLVNGFHSYKEKESALLTAKQRNWVRMQKLVSRFSLGWRPLPPSSDWGKWRRRCYIIVEHPWFDKGILLLIALNCVVLATAHYNQSERHAFALTVLNYIFVGIFGLEAVLKWVAWTFSSYLKDPWNRYDFVCITVSVIGVVLQINTTIFRIARVARAMRFLKRADRLRVLFQTLVRSIPSLANVGLLLLYIFFNWGIVGVSMFKDVAENEKLNRHENFRTLPAACLILFQVCTAETWTEVMEGTMVEPPDCDPARDNCGKGWKSIVYFSSFMIVGSFIFLNMFIYVVLDNFVEHRREMQGLVKDEFFDAFNLFQELWMGMDPFTSKKLSVDEFLAIAQQLPEPLWRQFGAQGKYGQETESQRWLNLLRNVQRLPIPVSSEREVRFDDCMMALAMCAIGIKKQDAAAAHSTIARVAQFFDPTVFTLEHVVAARRVEYFFMKVKLRKEVREAKRLKAEMVKANALLEAANKKEGEAGNKHALGLLRFLAKTKAYN